MTMPKSGTDASDFASLGLADTLVATLTTLGYEEPTPVQREAIPLMLAGRDLLAQAATGTGKTAAFALPMIQRLVEDEAGPPQAAGPRAGARRASWRCSCRKRSTSTRAAPASRSCRSTAARRWSSRSAP